MISYIFADMPYICTYKNYIYRIIHGNAYKRTHANTHTHIYIHLLVYIYIYIYIYMYYIYECAQASYSMKLCEVTPHGSSADFGFAAVVWGTEAAEAQ